MTSNIYLMPSNHPTSYPISDLSRDISTNHHLRTGRFVPCHGEVTDARITLTDSSLLKSALSCWELKLSSDAPFITQG